MGILTRASVVQCFMSLPLFLNTRVCKHFSVVKILEINP